VVAEGSEFDTVLTATSNTVCLKYDFHGDIPNIFSPESGNTAVNWFKINAVHIDTTNSSLKIYNKWGELVLESTNPSEGWNGNIANESKECPSGLYVYVLSLKQHGSGTYYRTGVVQLLR
ncbi:MAG: gliding motility-associated C-terminal domain-containing protein, partial [Bacteroidetes bacterium]|nr:gliding motility-associated C-terminal domain-containing protein [Bacteroidota bacterium]